MVLPLPPPEQTKTGSFLSIQGPGSRSSGGPRCRHTLCPHPPAPPLHAKATWLPVPATLCLSASFSLLQAPVHQEAALSQWKMGSWRNNIPASSLPSSQGEVADVCSTLSPKAQAGLSPGFPSGNRPEAHPLLASFFSLSHFPTSYLGS